MAFVYLIKEDNEETHYKIGMTKVKDVNKRLKQLQTGNPNELFLVDYHQTEIPFYIESSLHRFFSSKKTLNEWYDLSEEDISTFKSQCEKFELIAKTLKDNPFVKLK